MDAIDQGALSLLNEMLNYARRMVDEHPEITRAELANCLIERFSPTPEAIGSNATVTRRHRP